MGNMYCFHRKNKVIFLKNKQTLISWQESSGIKLLCFTLFLFPPPPPQVSSISLLPPFSLPFNPPPLSFPCFPQFQSLFPRLLMPRWPTGVAMVGSFPFSAGGWGGHILFRPSATPQPLRTPHTRKGGESSHSGSGGTERERSG